MNRYNHTISKVAATPRSQRRAAATATASISASASPGTADVSGLLPRSEFAQYFGRDDFDRVAVHGGISTDGNAFVEGNAEVNGDLDLDSDLNIADGAIRFGSDISLYANDGLKVDASVLEVTAIRLGGCLITWDSANNCLRFSTSIASEGGVTAMQ